jgi:hypothetical protein
VASRVADRAVFGSWLSNLGQLRHEYATAAPFPLVVIDDFLVPALADAVLAEFPAPDEMPRSRDYIFGRKHELSSVAARGPSSRILYDALMSIEFANALNEITDRTLFVDPAFHGGGFHQGTDGSFLDTHVDFNVHPEHPDWLRVLNVLLYLNKEWRAEYGGELLLRSAPEEVPIAIKPLFNRAVLMLTSDSTFHGYERMSLPPGVSRKSIATYAYEHIPVGSVSARTTGWAPIQSNLLKRMIASRYGGAVRIKNRLFGSATARNR